MTREREEAINLFEDNYTYIETHGHYSKEEEAKAYSMAIKALKDIDVAENILQEIRQEIAELRDSWEKDCYHDEADALSTAIKIIDKHIEAYKSRYRK